MGYNWTPRSETYVNIQFKRTYLKCWNWSNENPCFLVDEVNIGFGLQDDEGDSKDLEESEDAEDSEYSEDSEDEGDEGDEEDEEELFYKTFVLQSDDMWEALYEEEQKIEEFFQMRRKK